MHVAYVLAEVLTITSFFLETTSASNEGLQFQILGKRYGDSDLRKRGNIVGTSSLSDSGDVSYFTTISLGGSQFSVLIDTGSSDLWVAGSVQNSSSTGKSAGITYAIGNVSGPINTAQLDFAGYQVQNQAYIQVTSDASNPSGMGYIGLGPNKGSQIFAAVGDSSGDTVLNRIFKQNVSTPNYLTVLMGRHNDPTDTFPGDLTVGTVLPGYENITSQPKLDVTTVSISQAGDQHWQALLDPNGILGPDGQAISLSTGVHSTSNSKQLTVIFDTGFSLPQVPKSLSNAIYGRIPGATFVNRNDVGPIWQLPCDKEVNLTFIFQGIMIPIHPLDTNLDINVTDTAGNKVCVGAFQPITTSTGGLYDAILGMAFLRNAYLLINYGDFVDGTTNTAKPFVQLIPTTNDTAEAHLDFVNVRMNGVDQTNWSLLPSSSSDSTSSSSGSSVNWNIYGPIIGLVALLLIGAIISLSCRTVGRPKFFNTGTRYRPLEDPAPMDLHPLYQDRPPSYPNHAAEDYRNPWDSRY